MDAAPEAQTPARSPALLRAELGTWIALGLALWVLSMPSRDQTEDSLAHAAGVLHGWRLWHPHHLIFAPVLAGLRALAAPFGGAPDVVLVAQLHNALWLFIAVRALELLVRRLTHSVPLGLGIAAWVGFTPGVVEYASQVESYVPSLGCALLLFLQLAAWAEGAPLSVARAVALLALAVLFHQMNVLLVPAVVVYLVSAARPGGGQCALKVVGGAGALVLAIYLVAWNASAAGSAGSFTGGAGDTGFVAFCLSYAIVPEAETWGAAANVGWAGLAGSFAARLANFGQAPSNPATGVLGVAYALLVVWSVWRCFQDASTRAPRASLLAWALAYDAFFLWWLPTQREFYLVPLAPVAALLGLALADVARLARRPRLAAISGAAVLCAALVLLAPRSLALLRERSSFGPVHRIASEIASHAPPAAIHLATPYVLNTLAAYFGVPRGDGRELPFARWHIVLGNAEREPPLRSDRPLVVPWREVRPQPLPEVDPERWLAYFTWVFRLERPEDGDPDALLGRGVRALRLPSDIALVIQDGAPQRWADWSAFFTALDAAGASAGEPPAFARWWTRARTDD